MAKAPQLTGRINMFRVLFLAAAAVALAGCARSESAAEAAFRADDAKCKSYGADPGTHACRLAIDMQKATAEAEAARQRARTRR
jgi:outer membrane lipoprotein SlyB